MMTPDLPPFTLTLAASLPGSLATVFLALIPLAVAAWLLKRATRGSAAAMVSPAAIDLAALRGELSENYDRLRHNPEAVLLAVDVWRRFCTRTELTPVAVNGEVAQAYHAIEVSNRLLSASGAYDSRGHLSIKQRRLALWPTLESAVRAGLASLGSPVTPAIQVRIGQVYASESAALPAAVRITCQAIPAESVSALPTLVRASATPRLTLSYGPDAEAAMLRRHPAATELAKPPRKTARKRPAARLRRDLDGQMPLWESVA
jgi:hypothetical protein